MFNIGDYVKVIDPMNQFYGKFGTIDSIIETCDLCHINFGGGQSWTAHFNALKLADVGSGWSHAPVSNIYSNKNITKSCCQTRENQSKYMNFYNKEVCYCKICGKSV